MSKQEVVYDLNDLIYLMDRLRDPKDGCAWDLDQSYSTIVPSTIEEAYEAADAIERGDIDGLREELGDLMFQTVFYSQLAKEENRFTLNEVISGLVAKLVRRHPHVFPDGTLTSRMGDKAELSSDSTQVDSSSDVKKQWEDIKSGERAGKGQNSLMDDVPVGFPALLRAHKLQKRAARIGFDWPNNDGVFDKIQEEISEVKEAIAKNSDNDIEEELGDLLFSCVNLVRRFGFDSETTLRKASTKFEGRFRSMEKISEDLSSKTAEELEALWQQAKNLEKKL